MVLIIALFTVYSNILIIDDYHPKSIETIQESGNGVPNAPQEKPSGESTSESEQKNTQVKKGYHLHINLDELLLYVYKDGILLKTYPISGGKRSSPSPVGTWRIISKDTWGEGFGGAWLGLNVPWGKYGIHGTVYPWLIGKSNSSKGCIRMNNKDVKELYKMIPHGSTVTIIHNNKPFRSLKSGDIGSDVAEVQRALKKLGYYKGGIDGKFGNGMKQSVIKFQKANKILSNGTVGPQTNAAIQQLLNQRE